MPDFWKNKRVLVYIALAHHTRFLTPVLDELSQKGAIIEYVVGQAEKSQEITAIELGLSYSHVFDYLSEKDMDEIQKNYLKQRDLFSASLNTSFLYSATPITVIDKTIYATAMEYVGFKNLIKTKKPDLCFALHELNRWGKIFAFWAKKYHVPILTLQEGLYYALNFNYTGHTQQSTLNLVWGKRIKSKLEDFDAPGDKIIPVGNTHLAKEFELQKKNNIREKIRKNHKCEDDFNILLLFSGQMAKAEELLPIFKVVSQSDDKKLFIKFHPATKQESVDQWTASVPEPYQKNLRMIFEEESTYDLMSLSDVCVLIQPSTTGLEALFWGKPLIHLDVDLKVVHPYSFTDAGVSKGMAPEEFARRLSMDEDFSNLVDPQKVTAYLESELSETEHCVDRVKEIAEKLIRARKTKPSALSKPENPPRRKWSLIFKITQQETQLLPLLETIAVNSDGQGDFEVIIIEPRDLSEKAATILDSLKGDLIRIKETEQKNEGEMFNQAAAASSGERLLFLDKALLPCPNWLALLDSGMKKHGQSHIFGARVLDAANSVHHAGTVVDVNNAPISAYKHLNGELPGVLKERPFQMLDKFIGLDRNLFFDLGGFWDKTGKFKFLDICLRLNEKRGDEKGCIYLPQVSFISQAPPSTRFDPEASIHFFGKWHGVLWENQSRLYTMDGVTKTELDQAQMSQAALAAGI